MPNNIMRFIVVKTYQHLLDYLDSNEMVSTEQLAKEVGIKVENIDSQDMMRVHYEINRLAEAKGLKLDSSYADGLLIGTRYAVPYRVTRA